MIHATLPRTLSLLLATLLTAAAGCQGPSDRRACSCSHDAWLEDISPSGPGHRAGRPFGDAEVVIVVEASDILANPRLDEPVVFPTGRQLDIAIEGPGHLCVAVGDRSTTGLGYTRNGELSLDQDGNLVMANDLGHRIVPNIVIPPQATNISIATDGGVFYQDPAETEPVLAGRIKLARFPNDDGLERSEDGIWFETAASGEPMVGCPGDPGIGLGRLQSGFLCRPLRGEYEAAIDRLVRRRLLRQPW